MMQNPAEKLCAYVMREFGARLTARQVRGPWRYIGSWSGEISGVLIAADEDSTGYRVMLADIEAPSLSGATRWDLLRGEVAP